MKGTDSNNRALEGYILYMYGRQVFVLTGISYMGSTCGSPDISAGGQQQARSR
ncbi:hypothetical protein JCM6292_3852 [Bacteroides pyogenes JCM 6292]|uniref:Uncharacterized protein n=1 Tax=Bacteroides pyogenes JCM 6292 TaxID=1235809 RepID=W4PBW4_9BACE|nr:hypothetical protein JCM6292_3852 [Bacteroides pyogenes JCM 6292]